MPRRRIVFPPASPVPDVADDDPAPRRVAPPPPPRVMPYEDENDVAFPPPMDEAAAPLPENQWTIETQHPDPNFLAAHENLPPHQHTEARSFCFICDARAAAPGQHTVRGALADRLEAIWNERLNSMNTYSLCRFISDLYTANAPDAHPPPWTPRDVYRHFTVCSMDLRTILSLQLRDTEYLRHAVRARIARRNADGALVGIDAGSVALLARVHQMQVGILTRLAPPR